MIDENKLRAHLGWSVLRYVYEWIDPQMKLCGELSHKDKNSHENAKEYSLKELDELNELKTELLKFAYGYKLHTDHDGNPVLK